MRNILTQARALIEERGVTTAAFVNRGNFEMFCRREVELRPDTCFCMAGAVHYAQADFYDDGPIEALAAFLPEDFEPTLPGPNRVYQFNDANAQNVPAILEVFDRAIEAA